MIRFKMKGDCTIRVAKTKALISFTLIAKLICAFVFAQAKIRFSHDVAHIYTVQLVHKETQNIHFLL